ncbi:hypothetical protein AVEN_68153-1 [Araneus ventricosus]|uniref:Uncharacterized protein n=1 Tax=Araneus ventricosus TaxID=182803 RepID=A0A4Y2MVT5_ARAVE|nr:hypothetical protein AVEN_68153-1 [Araneus ventricosus]
MLLSRCDSIIALEAQKTNSTTLQDISTQTALPSLPFEADSKFNMPQTLLQQESSCKPPPVQSPQSQPPTLVLYLTDQSSEEKVDLSNLLLSNLPTPMAKIVNIKSIESNSLAISLASCEESAILNNEISNNESLK